MASAACPKCKILVVQADDDSGDGLYLSQMAAASLGATVISNSWGGPEDNTVASSEMYFNHSGIAIFVASGDSGYNDGGQGPDYPSTSAYTIAVGGTTLTSSTNSRGWTEKAWSGGGSSCSTNVAKPSWQTSTACAKRMASDVSAVGDPNTGLAVYNNGQWQVVGGTSAASPLVAGIYALTKNGGATAQFAYQNAGAFYDVTSGTNGTCTAPLCKSAAGWDGPTGVGTPNGAMLATLGGTGTGSGSGAVPEWAAAVAPVAARAWARAPTWAAMVAAPAAAARVVVVATPVVTVTTAATAVRSRAVARRLEPAASARVCS